MKTTWEEDQMTDEEEMEEAMDEYMKGVYKKLSKSSNREECERLGTLVEAYESANRPI